MKQLEFTTKRTKKAYVAQESARMAREGMTEHQIRAELKERDLSALKAMQASRPLKPPGRL
jgi:reverse gyrase